MSCSTNKRRLSSILCLAAALFASPAIVDGMDQSGSSAMPAAAAQDAVLNSVSADLEDMDGVPITEEAAKIFANALRMFVETHSENNNMDGFPITGELATKLTQALKLLAEDDQ